MYHANMQKHERWHGYSDIIETKTVTRDKESCFIMIKGTIHEEAITILNICVPNKSTKYIQQKLTENH